MSENISSIKTSKKNQIGIFAQKTVSAFVGLFCFFLFPAFIIFNALDLTFTIKKSNLRQHKLEQMKTALEHLEKASDNSRYLHYILHKISTSAQNQKNYDFLEKNLRNLKKQYPGDLEFIVWDARGNIVNNLTDQKSFRYILSKLFEVFKEAAEALSVDDQAVISELPVLNRNLNLIRQFLGKIFIPDSLRKPYLKNTEAGPILSDFASRYSHFWYQIGDQASLFCFISEKLVKSHSGLEKLAQHLNNHKDFWCGYSLSQERKADRNSLPPGYAGTLATALATFENLAEPVFENERFLILISLPQPGIKAWCLHEKQAEQWSTAFNRDQIFARIISLMLIFYLLLFSWFRLKQEFFSIRWKLTGLFILANMAPLAIMGFISHDYLYSKKEALFNNIKTDLNKFIRNIDSRFPVIQEEISDILNQQFDSLNRSRQTQNFNETELVSIKKIYENFSPNEVYLISSATRTIFSQRLVNRKASQKIEFIPALGAAVLKFCNGIILPRNKKDMFSSILSPDDSDFVRRSFRDSRQVIPVNMGQTQKLCYWFIFGNSAEYATDHFLILMWERERLHELFLDKYFQKAAINQHGFQLYAENRSGARTWPADKPLPASLRKQIQRAAGFKDNISGTFAQENDPLIFSAQRGRNLDSIVLTALFPENNISKEISNTRKVIIAGVFVSLFLTLIICHVISGQFLLPINNLREATTAISNHQFNHRIPATDEDEFGRLNLVFNRVIEGLGELEVAKIVQESLFPGNHFNAGNYRIYGRSVVMTTLGGDYYDCLPLDEKKWGVVIGDVAGHGVPAGLMMAMAKAGVLMSGPEEKNDPARLTSKLHQIFFAIKNDRLKRMMTFQYFVINTGNNQVSFANAGHCFPVLLKPSENQAEFIEHISTPLGIGPKARYKNYLFEINPGEALVLYTDGIAEAKNAQGEEFGFDSLKPLFLKSYDPDPEVFYQRVYSAYNSWSAKPDDDLTLIMITCCGDKKS